MVERATAPRLSASVGAAIRQARTGRFSLAELARKSGTSVGVLSLIERGMGNPSFETLARVADALGMSLASLVEAGTNPKPAPAARRGSIPADRWADDREATEDIANGVTVLRPDRAIAWRDSMILRPGQEAVVLVNAGIVELTLRDRSEEFDAGDPGEPLSVDISVRGRPFVPRMELPPVGDPRWGAVVGGTSSFRPTVLACQILFTHVTRSVRDDPSPSNVHRWVADLRAALLKYEDLSALELASIFDKPG